MDEQAALLGPVGMDGGAAVAEAVGVRGGFGSRIPPILESAVEHPRFAGAVDHVQRVEDLVKGDGRQPQLLGDNVDGDELGGLEHLIVVLHLGGGLLELGGVDVELLLEQLLGGSLLLELGGNGYQQVWIGDHILDGGVGGGEAVAQQLLDAVVAPDGEGGRQPAGEL